MEILSALILDGERIKEIRDLTPEMFDDPVLRQMYAEYWESDKPIGYDAESHKPWGKGISCDEHGAGVR